MFYCPDSSRNRLFSAKKSSGPRCQATAVRRRSLPRPGYLPSHTVAVQCRSRSQEPEARYLAEPFLGVSNWYHASAPTTVDVSPVTHLDQGLTRSGINTPGFDAFDNQGSFSRLRGPTTAVAEDSLCKRRAWTSARHHTVIHRRTASSKPSGANDSFQAYPAFVL